VFGDAVIRDDISGILGRDSLERRIVQHCIRNEDDWSNEELLTHCGVMNCSQTLMALR